MSICKWNRERADYVTPDGDLCRHDDEGDPTRHCTARRTCSHHVGYRELTCARCLGRVRQVIRKIRDHAPLMPTAAELAGINSEAAYLAGPAADYATFSARRNINRRWLMDNIPERNLERAMTAYIEDDDTDHPYTVLTRWEFMLREDYGEQRETPTSIESAAEYLDRRLNKVAQDDEQDFPLMRRELETCWNNMQIPLAIKAWHEKGAPCPTCADRGVFARLTRENGHWCTDEDCTKIHFVDESGDVWRCPIKAEHWWNPQGYADLLAGRRAG